MSGDERKGTGVVRPGAPGGHVVVEMCPKRVRVFFGGAVVADSIRVRLLHERGHLPVYYFPLDDLRGDLLQPSELRTHCPLKGDARYWSVQVGDRVARDAVWNYPDPVESCPAIGDLAAFYWDGMDAWYEEDERVYVHARDPYTRIDVLESSRRVRVQAGGVMIADSRRPIVLFETGLPVRYYLPMLDVDPDCLRPSDTVTACPYKGTTSRYWTVEAGGVTVEDAAWCYRHPSLEVAPIAGRISFYNHKVDLQVDER